MSLLMLGVPISNTLTVTITVRALALLLGQILRMRLFRALLIHSRTARQAEVLRVEPEGGGPSEMHILHRGSTLK